MNENGPVDRRSRGGHSRGQAPGLPDIPQVPPPQAAAALAVFDGFAPPIEKTEICWSKFELWHSGQRV